MFVFIEDDTHAFLIKRAQIYCFYHTIANKTKPTDKNFINYFQFFIIDVYFTKNSITTAILHIYAISYRKDER